LQRVAHRCRDDRFTRARDTARVHGKPDRWPLPNPNRRIEGAGARGHGHVSIHRRVETRHDSEGDCARKSHWSVGCHRVGGSRRRRGHCVAGRTSGLDDSGRDSRAPSRSGVFHRRSDHLGRPAMKRLLILAMTAAAPALAQLQFFIVDNTGERAAQPVVDLGPVYEKEKIPLNFLLRNTSTSPVQVTTLTWGGGGFTLRAPPVPITLGSQSALTISVSFQSADAGNHSATLRSD